MAYFSYFNKIGYDLSREDESVKLRSITNVLNRVRKKLEITNAAIFEQYFVNDGDRADTLAYQYYDDASLWWIIASANNIHNAPFGLTDGTILRIPQNYIEILSNFNQ